MVETYCHRLTVFQIGQQRSLSRFFPFSPSFPPTPPLFFPGARMCKMGFSPPVGGHRWSDVILILWVVSLAGLSEETDFSGRWLNLRAKQQTSLLCWRRSSILSFPPLWHPLIRLFFIVTAFLYKIPALYLVISPFPKAPPSQCSVSGPCVASAVKRVSVKRDGRGSAGEWKCRSGMSVGDCISVGVLHVLFLQNLS